MKWRSTFTVAVLGALVVGWMASRPQGSGPPEVVLPEPGPWNPGPVGSGGVRHLSGVVLTDAGGPAADAVVLRRAVESSTWTFTDAQGRFELANLPEGALALTILFEGSPPTQVDVGPDPGPVEIRLRPPHERGTRLDVLDRSPLIGSVFRHDGRPLADWEVLLEPEDPLADQTGALPRRAAVGPDGRFEIPELVHGRYRAVLLPPWARGGRWPDVADPRTVAIGHPGPAPALRAAGGWIEGVVRDSAGGAVEGAMLLLRSTTQPERIWPPHSTDARGAYEIGDLPPGRYDLEVLAGEADRWIVEIAVRASIATRQDVDDLEIRSR